MNAINTQFAASARFAFAANVAGNLAAVMGAMKQVSYLKRQWHSLHAWMEAEIESISIGILSLVTDGRGDFSIGRSLLGPVPVPCPVATRRYGTADLARSVAGDLVRSVGRRGFRQRPVSHS
jgi:hypothetical protein